MVLAQINNKPGKYAIIDLSHNPAIAFGEAEGNTTYDGITYPVCRSVLAGQDIAPMGNSDATNVHLHLYLTADPNINPNNNIDNAKNPLQFIDHVNTNFDISIDELFKLTYFPIASTPCGGNQKASVKVKLEMPGAGNSQNYDNEVMDIDSVLLFIKRFGENDDKYALIKGDRFHSKIVLGGRLDHKRYPSIGWPVSNSGFDIVNQFGNEQFTGIEPYAYNTHPYDFWCFSDFYTRIKSTDYLDGYLELANSNAEARYPDGIYYIKPKAYRISGIEAVNPNNTNNNQAKQIIIDNFRPYISRVKIYEGPHWSLKYERGWQWVNNTLLFEPQPASAVFNQNQDVMVEVTTSEPMNEVRVSVGNSYSTLQTAGTDLNKTKWIFVIPKTNLTEGQQILYINGKDLAGNPIQDKPGIIPIRQSNDTWSPAPTCGQGPEYNPDTYHSFIFGNSMVDFDAVQQGSEINTIRFSDKSSAAGISSYFWNFGNTPNSTSTIKNPYFQYPNMGVYFVTHSITAGTQYVITKPVAVSILTPPVIKNIYYSPFFGNGKSAGQTVKVDFFSDCEGIIADYTWSIDGNIYHDENPEQIELLEKTWYSVQLTVTNAAANAPISYTQMVYIDPDLYPYTTIQDWEVTYFVHDLEVNTGNFNDNEPVEFTIDYGDGITESYTEDFKTYHTFTHNYYELGEYIVKATVKQGQHTEVRTAKRIRVQPYDLVLNMSYTALNTPPRTKEKIDFNASVANGAVGTNYVSCWGIYKIGDPDSYRAQTFSGTQIQPFQFTPDQAGKYKIMLDVYVSTMSTCGHAGMEIDVENAPKYVDANITSDSYLLSLNSEYTLLGSVWPKGEPGITEEDWNPTNIRWTLTGPQTNIVQSSQFAFDEYNFTHYFTHKFDKEGQYTLLLETWNNQHQYEQNNELDTSNNCRLSYYNYDVKHISVRASIPSIQIDYPEPLQWYQPSADAQALEIKISNPSSTAITWEADMAAGCGVVDWFTIHNSSGENLKDGQQQSVFVDITENPDESNRSGCIHIHGRLNGIEVQGSPAWVQIDQYGKSGPWMYAVEGVSLDRNFGFAVAMDGNNAVIGSPHNYAGVGQAYIYRKTNVGFWERKSLLKSIDSDSEFGNYADIAGDYACVLGSDKVYFYKRGIPDWEETVEATACYPVSAPKSVAIWGDYAAVGSPSANFNKGKVTIFYRNQGGTDRWGIVKEISGELIFDSFGNSVDLYNDQLVVGAPQAEGGQGYVKIFNRNQEFCDDWGTEQKIDAPVLEEGQSGPSEFGKTVSIFENTFSTSYYYWIPPTPYQPVGGHQCPISFSKNSSGNWEEIGRADCNMVPAGNQTNSASMFKEIYSPGHEQEFRTLFGIPSEEYTLDDGTTGPIGSFLYSYYCHSSNAYHYYAYIDKAIKEGVPYTPRVYEKYGNSVSKSYLGEVIGAPGHLADGIVHGAAIFDRNYAIGNNFMEAGIDLPLINFTKPAGSYSDVIARNISLGGRAMPATIQSGATIHYKAKELLLQDGFQAEKGSTFTAEASKFDSLPIVTHSYELAQKTDPYQWPLTEETRKFLIQAYMHAFPDFPWRKYNLYGIADFEQDEKTVQYTISPEVHGQATKNNSYSEPTLNLPVLLLQDPGIKLRIKNSTVANR
ncbi:MAG: 3-coathanger stack domain-containing protein [Bacteroidota bacterium]